MQKRAALDENPYAGNPHVRSDEGEVASATPRRWSILYNKLIVSVIAMSAVFAAAAMPTETEAATAGKEKIAKTSEGANENVGKSEDCVKAERAIYDKLSKIRIPYFKTKRGMDLAEVIEWFRGASKKYDIEPGKPGINFVLKLDGEIPRVPWMSGENIALGDLVKLVVSSVDYDYKVEGSFIIVFKKKMNKLIVSANANEAVEPVSAMAGPIEVCADPNVELICVVCHLAGYEEYDLSEIREERDAVREWFGSYTNHPTVKAFANYRKEFEIAYDAPASLSIHLKSDLSGYLTSLEPWPERLDERWKKADLEEVRRQLVEFRDASRFGDWYSSRTAIYSARVGEAIKQIGELSLPKWLSGYYGPQKHKSRLRVVVSKLMYPSNFGTSAQVSDDEVLYSPIISCDPIVLPHEFSHPFTIAPGNRMLREVEAKSPDAFAGLKKEFGKALKGLLEQWYGDMPIWWRETFNRANEMRYYRACLPKMEERCLEYNESRGFALVRPLCKLLDEYEADREKYKTLDDFVPVVVDFLVERYSTAK